jgi:peptide chain release factor subunit 1
MDESQRQFQERVEQAVALSGSGTQLVTVWIPPGKNLQSVRRSLRNERSESENIKSKQTRERVQGALERTTNVLHKYDETPENGLVVCCGNIDGDYYTFVFDDLPEPIRDSKYACSDEFELDGLLEMAFGGSEWWGLLVVTRDSASVGRYSNSEFDYVDVIDCFESHVMGKSKAGGQSAQRFERLRQEQAENHYKKVVRLAERNFDVDDPDFQGIALAGPNVTLSTFVDFLPSRLQDEIVTRETIDHAGDR